MTEIRSNDLICHVDPDFDWKRGYEFEGRRHYALLPLLEPTGPEKLLMSRDFEFGDSCIYFSANDRNSGANQLSTSAHHCWWVANQFRGNAKHRDRHTVMTNPTYAGRMTEAIIKQRRVFRARASVKERIADWELMTRAYNDEK
jgi:hypothetical protein